MYVVSGVEPRSPETVRCIATTVPVARGTFLTTLLLVLFILLVCVFQRDTAVYVLITVDWYDFPRPTCCDIKSCMDVLCKVLTVDHLQCGGSGGMHNQDLEPLECVYVIWSWSSFPLGQNNVWKTAVIWEGKNATSLLAYKKENTPKSPLEGCNSWPL